MYKGKRVANSDESEQSWLKPELELKNFQLGSVRLVAFLPLARELKIGQNKPIFLFYLFLICPMNFHKNWFTLFLVFV